VPGVYGLWSIRTSYFLTFFQASEERSVSGKRQVSFLIFGVPCLWVKLTRQKAMRSLLVDKITF